MKIEGGKKGLLLKIIDEQFRIIGEKISFEDISEDEVILVNGKKKKWFDHYKFTEEQEKKWREWSWKELEILGDENRRRVMNWAELRYGFTLKYAKKGELF